MPRSQKKVVGSFNGYCNESFGDIILEVQKAAEVKPVVVRSVGQLATNRFKAYRPLLS
jgi:hypothetical protein